MPKCSKSKTPWKRFQQDALYKLRDLIQHDHSTAATPGAVAYATELSDGMVNLGSNSPTPFVHAYPAPSDHMAICNVDPAIGYGPVALVECKRISAPSRSLPVIPKGTKGSGLKEHQMRILAKAHACGQVGLLLVCFETGGVWALDGLGLALWASGADNPKSISLEFFQEQGQALGVEADWRLDASLLRPYRPKAGAKAAWPGDGPLYQGVGRWV